MPDNSAVQRLNFLKPLLAASAVDTALKYRATKFDKDWSECVIYDEAYTKEKWLPKGADEYLDYQVELAHVALNNERKAAAIGAVDIVPEVFVPSIQLNPLAEVRNHVLRWGFRSSGAIHAIRDIIHDLVMVGRGWGHLTWDETALDGQGAPDFAPRNFFDLYVDPQSRLTDINRDCRYVIDMQHYSAADLMTNWPDYFQHPSAPPSGMASAVIQEYEQRAKMLQNFELMPEEGGDFPIARIEFMTVENKRRKVMAGILDPISRAWIEEPIDTGLSVYSYIPFAIRNRRGYAYPLAPNLKEHELCDLTNLFYSLAVQMAILTGAPPIWYKQGDTAVKRALKDDKFVRPGRAYEYALEPPVSRPPQDPSIFLTMGATLDSRTNESGMISPIQKGEIPKQIVSGRAMQTAVGYANMPMERYSAAVEQGAAVFMTTLDQLVRYNVTGYREMVNADRAQKRTVPVNVPQSNPQFKKMLKTGSTPEQPMYLSARFRDKSGTIRATSIQEAERLQTSGKIESFTRFINDLMVGQAEIRVGIKPQLSPEQVAQRALAVFQMGAGGPLYLHHELGTENATEVVREVDERDQALQLGRQMMEHPEIIQAGQKALSDPLLSKLVGDSQALGHVKLLVNSSLLRAQEQAETEKKKQRTQTKPGVSRRPKKTKP